MSDIRHYIGGSGIDGTSGRWGSVFNPATGEEIRRVAFADKREVDRAVAAAAAAFPQWAATPPLTRARILFKFLEHLSRERDALARLAKRTAAVADTIHDHDPGRQREQWRRFSGEMRRSAHELAVTLAAGDERAIPATARRLVATCQSCHATFRD